MRSYSGRAHCQVNIVVDGCMSKLKWSVTIGAVTFSIERSFLIFSTHLVIQRPYNTVGDRSCVGWTTSRKREEPTSMKHDFIARQTVKIS